MENEHWIGLAVALPLVLATTSRLTSEASEPDWCSTKTTDWLI